MVLLSFVLLLMLSLSSLVNIELSSTSQQRAMLEAETNALLAVNLALGDLQKYAGPDQRVTARADVLGGTNSVYWTGVWSAEPDASGTQSAIKDRAPLKWLVSEPGASDGELPDPVGFAPEEDPITLLDTRTNTTDPVEEGDLIQLTKQPVSGGQGAVNGYYAYWVADDGVKASVALPVDETTTTTSSNLEARNPRRMALDAVSDDFAALLKNESDPQAYTDNIERLGLPVDMAGVTQVLDGNEELVREHFHDLTTIARGVQANVRDGGLKKDLTAAFSDDAEFSKLLAFHGSDQIFDHQGPTQTAKDPGGPEWAQLRSFFELRPDATGQISPRPQLDDQMGVYPVISHFSLHQHLLVYQESPGSTTYVPRLCIFPIVVLWNPYDTPIEATTYYMKLASYNWATGLKEQFEQDISPRIYLTQDDGKPETISNSGNAPYYREAPTFENTKEPYRFVINAPTIQPGEALIFSPGQIDEMPSNPAESVELSLGFNDGMYYYRESPGRFVNIDLNNNPLFEVSDFAFNLHNANYIRLTLATGSIANLDDENFLQHVSGMNYFIKGSGGGLGPTKFAATNANLIRDNDLSEVQNAITFGHPALTGVAEFPGAGIFMHLKMVENFAEVNNNDKLDSSLRKYLPYIRSLANYNPRAPRSSKSPLENAQLDSDMGFNPSYFGVEEAYKAGGPANHSYKTFNPGDTSIALGYSDNPSNFVGDGWSLFDIPQDGSYFLSVGDFSQANLSQPFNRPPTIRPFQDYLKKPAASYNIQNTWPAYAIGNSLQDPRIPAGQLVRDVWPDGNKSSEGDGYYHYDVSYLLNDVLWDQYFLSAYDSTTLDSLNRRYDLDSDFAFGFDESAGDLLVNGSFNVNSTSVEAWKAFLSSALGVEIVYEGGTFYSQTDVPLLRTGKPQNADAPNDRSNDTDEVYNGFLTLDEDDIEALAVAIVEQVKQRGPFISLSHFINRVVADPDYRSTKEGTFAGADPHSMIVGALQAAIDASEVNQVSPEDSSLKRFNQSDSFTGKYNKLTDDDTGYNIAAFYRYLDVDASLGDIAAGNPGYLTQADLLKAMGPYISVRSDTFTIYGYGESVSALTGKPLATARCAVTVQRVSDFVDDSSGDEPSADLSTVSTINQNLGRAFRVVDFQWLNEENG